MEDNFEKKVEGNKKGNGLGQVLLIILILLVGIGIGFGIKVYLDSSNEKESIKTEKADSKEEQKLENLSITDEKVTQAKDYFDSLGIDAAKKYGYDIKNISKKDLINTAIGQLKKEQINYCSTAEVAITIDDFNKALHEMFPDQSITIDDIKNNKNEETSYPTGEYGYSYRSVLGAIVEYAFVIKESNIYILGPCGFEGPYSNMLKRKLVKAELDDEYLYVYENVAFGKDLHPSEDNVTIDYYSDYAYTNKVETIGVSDEPSDWTKYKTYKLTFEKGNGKYSFVSSELVD